MLASTAKPVFVTACAFNLAFSVLGAFSLESAHHPVSLLATIGGGLSFVIAAASALMMLRAPESLDRPWIKAALVFLVLGPLAFWGLQMPAAAEVTEGATARVIGDVIQSQIAMIAVAMAAVFCAARAMTAMLDDLAV